MVLAHGSFQGLGPFLLGAGLGLLALVAFVVWLLWELGKTFGWWR